MKWLMTTLVVMSVGVCPSVIGQSVTEYGLGAGRAATTTAPAGNAASGIKGTFDALSKAAGSAQKNDAAESTASPSIKPSTPTHKTRRRTQSQQSGNRAPAATQPEEQKPAAITAAYEDPQQIQPGIAYEELVRRFGPPAMSVTTQAGSKTLWYARGENTYNIQLEDGKVVAAPATRPE